MRLCLERRRETHGAHGSQPMVPRQVDTGMGGRPTLNPYAAAGGRKGAQDPMSTRWPTSRRTRPVPPGPRGHPWLGVLPQMRGDSLGFLSAMVRTYGDIVALPLGPVRVYLLCHPEHVAYVLQ